MHVPGMAWSQVVSCYLSTIAYMYERMTVLLLLVLAVDGWKDPIGRICLIFHVKNTHAREEQRKYHQKEASQQNDHLLQ